MRQPHEILQHEFSHNPEGQEKLGIHAKILNKKNSTAETWYARWTIVQRKLTKRKIENIVTSRISINESMEAGSAMECKPEIVSYL